MSASDVIIRNESEICSNRNDEQNMGPEGHHLDTTNERMGKKIFGNHPLSAPLVKAQVVFHSI